MSSDSDKRETLGGVELKEYQVAADTEKTSQPPEGEEDDRITLKTKLAVLSLIFMYESYLFTLLM